MGRRIPADETHRTCVTCHLTLPVERFHSSGHGNGRRRTCTRCLNDARRRESRRQGAPVRHTRCRHCRLVEDFKSHPSRPGVLWSYCRTCIRERDRERYARKVSTYEGAMAVLEDRNRRSRRQAAAGQRERRRFVQEAITLLRRRGLTKAEIVRLTSTSVGNLLPRARATCCAGSVARAASPRRFGVVARETADLPIGDELAFRRRLPHPAFGELLARCLPQVQVIPVRSKWKNGGRS